MAHDKELFDQQFNQYFSIVFVSTDHEALAHIKREQNISAVFVDQENIDAALQSPIFSEVTQHHPDCLKVLLNQDIEIDAILKLLESRTISKCFSKPYDSDLIRSNIFTSNMGLTDQTSSSLSETLDKQIPKVLIVDDETSATKYLKKGLERLPCDFEILTAANAEQALTELSEHQESIAVIMTDQRMPGLQGNQLLNEIRHSHPHIVRILTSAYGEIDVALGAVNEGKIFRYITKPWDAKDVFATLNAALDEHNSLKATFRKKQNSIEDEYQKIVEKRMTTISSYVCRTFDSQVVNEALSELFKHLKQFPPSHIARSHIRASAETDLETQIGSELVTSLNIHINQLLASKRSLDTLHKVNCTAILCELIVNEFNAQSTKLSKLKRPFFEQEFSQEIILAQKINVELMHALDSILMGAALSRSALKLEQRDEHLVLSTRPEHSIKIYKHLLSPLTKTSSTLVEHQAAMLILILIAKILDGKLEINSLERSFKFSLYLPCNV